VSLHDVHLQYSLMADAFVSVIGIMLATLSVSVLLNGPDPTFTIFVFYMVTCIICLF
jgi:hypothetical protein